MPTYVYETIPAEGGSPVRRFEVTQRMSDDPLTEDPETGEPVRRVITGGVGLVSGDGGGTPAHTHGPGCCGGGCGRG